MSRWGIIYCPKVGKRHSHKQWERIREYLAEKQVEYDFVQSESTDSVERLATMLVQNGYQRIVIVGGDSALNRALNGILSQSSKSEFKDQSQSQSQSPSPSIELAVIPYGFINDFAHYWGFTEDDCRRSIDWIIGGRVRTVDVGYVEDEANHVRRYFLNCVNIGLASDLMNIQRTSRRWGILRYFNRSLRILFRRKERVVHLHVNRDEVHRSVMNVCIGSCRGYGQTPNAVPYSGLLDVSITNHPRLRNLGQGLWLLASGRFLTFKDTEAHRTRSKITVTDTGGALVSLDGLIYSEFDRQSFSIGLLHEHIKFIIPPINY